MIPPLPPPDNATKYTRKVGDMYFDGTDYFWWDGQAWKKVVPAAASSSGNVLSGRASGSTGGNTWTWSTATTVSGAALNNPAVVTGQTIQPLPSANQDPGIAEKDFHLTSAQSVRDHLAKELEILEELMTGVTGEVRIALDDALFYTRQAVEQLDKIIKELK